MKFSITFEYEVEDENEAREIRDTVSAFVHDLYKNDHRPDNWFYSWSKSPKENS